MPGAGTNYALAQLKTLAKKSVKTKSAKEAGEWLVYLEQLRALAVEELRRGVVTINGFSHQVPQWLAANGALDPALRDIVAQRIYDTIVELLHAAAGAERPADPRALHEGIGLLLDAMRSADASIDQREALSAVARDILAHAEIPVALQLSAATFLSDALSGSSAHKKLFAGSPELRRLVAQAMRKARAVSVQVALLTVLFRASPRDARQRSVFFNEAASWAFPDDAAARREFARGAGALTGATFATGAIALVRRANGRNTFADDALPVSMPFLRGTVEPELAEALGVVQVLRQGTLDFNDGCLSFDSAGSDVRVELAEIAHAAIAGYCVRVDGPRLTVQLLVRRGSGKIGRDQWIEFALVPGATASAATHALRTKSALAEYFAQAGVSAVKSSSPVRTIRVGPTVVSPQGEAPVAKPAAAKRTLKTVSLLSPPAVGTGSPESLPPPAKRSRRATPFMVKLLGAEATERDFSDGSDSDSFRKPVRAQAKPRNAKPPVSGGKDLENSPFEISSSSSPTAERAAPSPTVERVARSSTIERSVQKRSVRGSTKARTSRRRTPVDTPVDTLPALQRPQSQTPTLEMRTPHVPVEHAGRILSESPSPAAPAAPKATSPAALKATSPATPKETSPAEDRPARAAVMESSPKAPPPTPASPASADPIGLLRNVKQLLASNAGEIIPATVARALEKLFPEKVAPRNESPTRPAFTAAAPDLENPPALPVVPILAPRPPKQLQKVPAPISIFVSETPQQPLGPRVLPVGNPTPPSTVRVDPATRPGAKRVTMAVADRSPGILAQLFTRVGEALDKEMQLKEKFLVEQCEQGLARQRASVRRLQARAQAQCRSTLVALRQRVEQQWAEPVALAQRL